MFVVAPIVVLQPSCRGCVTRSVLLGLDCCCCSICLTGIGLLFIYWLLLLPLSEGDYFFIYCLLLLPLCVGVGGMSWDIILCHL